MTTTDATTQDLIARLGNIKTSLDHLREDVTVLTSISPPLSPGHAAACKALNDYLECASRAADVVLTYVPLITATP